MPRGRQYYDPEIQANRLVETPADLARIEFYPELDGSGQIGRWVARRIDHDGRIVGYTAGNFDHDAELAHAQEMWPGLEIFELPDEQTDSTWEGTGPSPRIWQVPPAVEPKGAPEPVVAEVTPDRDAESVRLRGLTVEAGTYLHVDDVKELLRSYAHIYDLDGNPSAALALRTAADMLGG